MVVKYVTPSESDVIPFEEFGGRTLSPDTVELRSRVSGYLKKVNFVDGAEVQAGQVLFEIEDTTYNAELAQAEATVLQREADVRRIQSQLERFKRLAANAATTEQEVERLTFETQAAVAAHKAAEAMRDHAKLNVNFTRVVSPIKGRIGRRLVDPGNIVQQDVTPLAVVVSLDPIYAYFDYDERSVLAMRRLVETGRLKEAPDRGQPIQVQLAGESDYTMTGHINWVDNQIDMGTGTLRARVAIDNSKKLLSPGMFVRLRVPVGPEERGLLIPEEALGTDQGQRFVYVVKEGKEGSQISYQKVQVGWVTDRKCVITSGLAKDDRVVVTGLQRVRPNMKVKPEPMTPPASAGETAAQQPAAPAEMKKLGAESPPAIQTVRSGEGASPAVPRAP